MSSINNNEERETHSKSDNIETMINDEKDEVEEELFQLKSNEVSSWVGNTMKGSNFIFDCAYSSLHKK